MLSLTEGGEGVSSFLSIKAVRKTRTKGKFLGWGVWGRRGGGGVGGWGGGGSVVFEMQVLMLGGSIWEDVFEGGLKGEEVGFGAEVG